MSSIAVAINYLINNIPETTELMVERDIESGEPLQKNTSLYQTFHAIFYRHFKRLDATLID